MAEDKVYVEFTSPIGDADLGKISEGDIRVMDAARAERFKTVGVAKDSTEAAYKKFRDGKTAKADPRGRQADFAALERQAKSDDWDTSTTRDVTMAPEEGIRRAYQQGRLVNTDMLRDADGNVLPQDASLEQILEARNNLAFQESPLTAHDRSSVQGGGSHASQIFATPSVAGEAPLNASHQLLSPEQLGNAPEGETHHRRGAKRVTKAEAEAAKVAEGAKDNDG